MNNPSPYAVIFDLDGTLIDSMRSFNDIVISNLEKKGIILTTDAMETIGVQLLKKFQAPQRNSGFRLVFNIFWSIGREMGLGRLNSLKFALNCINKVKSVYENAPMFPDVKQSLFKLKNTGFQLGICTNASRQQLEDTIVKHGIKEFFHPEAMISRDDVERIKPDPEGLLLVIEACSTNPQFSYFLGDMPVDILAGNDAGVQTIGLTTGLVSKSVLHRYSNPSIVVDSLEQATSWILESRNLK
ncbi:MAG: HAD family hydrolase [Candidatus Hodarchaeales archaeon]|jgi:phosphoglycolate phosphatase-like HAD superfamily hydrolase